MSETIERRGDVMRFGSDGSDCTIIHTKGNKNKGWTPEEARKQPAYFSFDNDEGLPMTKAQWQVMDDDKALAKIQEFDKIDDSEAKRMLKMLRNGESPIAQDFGYKF